MATTKTSLTACYVTRNDERSYTIWLLSQQNAILWTTFEPHSTVLEYINHPPPPSAQPPPKNKQKNTQIFEMGKSGVLVPYTSIPEIYVSVYSAI